MAWRSVMIQNPATLNLSQGQLRLRNEDGEHTLPVEDLTALVLECPQITLSSTLLSFCQEQGVAVLTCDKTHMPNGVLLPFQPHSRQSRVAHIQISASDGLKNRLWQRVVRSKIENQASCLRRVQGEEQAKRLDALAGRVKPSDSENVEAQAARYYWPRLMGEDFRRGGNDSVNAALNYGYAVIRAFVARSQVSYGLLPTFGIHHSNELNAFNLTDDMMEVFRPFADREVCTMREEGLLPEGEERLSVPARQRLANMGHASCRMEGQTHTIANACDKMAMALVNAIEKKSAALLSLPSFEDRAPES